MDLKNLYYEIKSNLEKIDFSKLWCGFKPLKFALYTDDECFFDGEYIEKNDAFLANTSIFYDGEWIAIWYVQEAVDTTVLTSKIVHEMFHGFQQMNSESRFADELDALYNYKYDEDNINLKLTENKLIYSLTENFDKEAFEKFLKIRRHRFDSFRYNYHYESCIEQIEGAANYVELQCLKQLSGEAYEKKLSAMREAIVDLEGLLPIRVVCYDTGALLLHVMAENGIAFDSGFLSVPFAESVLDGIEGKRVDSEFSAKEMLDSFNAEASKTVRMAIAKRDLVNDVECDLLAVNIYNAVFCENHIISRYFVVFGSENERRVEYGDFVIESSAYKKATKIYRI